MQTKPVRESNDEGPKPLQESFVKSASVNDQIGGVDLVLEDYDLPWQAQMIVSVPMESKDQHHEITVRGNMLMAELCEFVFNKQPKLRGLHRFRLQGQTFDYDADGEVLLQALVNDPGAESFLKFEGSFSVLGGGKAKRPEDQPLRTAELRVKAKTPQGRLQLRDMLEASNAKGLRLQYQIQKLQERFAEENLEYDSLSTVVDEIPPNLTPEVDRAAVLMLRKGQLAQAEHKELKRKRELEFENDQNREIDDEAPDDTMRRIMGDTGPQYFANGGKRQFMQGPQQYQGNHGEDQQSFNPFMQGDPQGDPQYMQGDPEQVQYTQEQLQEMANQPNWIKPI